MITSTLSFAIATLVAAVVMPYVRRVSLRYEWIDATGPRKIHTRPVPRLGGVGIVLGFYAPLVALLLSGAPLARLLLADRSRVVGLFVCGAIIAALGVYDDIRGTQATTKLVVQIAAAIMLYASGFRITQVSSPFGGVFQLGAFAVPVTVLWIVGVINAVNLVDGLDGLAGGVAFVGLSAVFVIAWIRGEPTLMFTAAALAGSVLGFLFYNFNPASIFMGDGGSMFLGLMLSTSTIRASQKSSTAVAMLIPFLLLALPLADTALAIGRRFLRRQSLFTADREHIHHRLLHIGFSQRQSVAILYSVSVACGGLAVICYGHELRFWFAAIVMIAVAASLLAIRSLDVARARSLTRTGVWPHIVSARQQLHGVRTVDEAWSVVRHFAEAIEARRMEMSVIRRSGEERVTRSFLWERGVVPETDAQRLVEALGEHCSVALTCEPDEEALEQRRQALRLIAAQVDQVVRREDRIAPRRHRGNRHSLPGTNR